MSPVRGTNFFAVFVAALLLGMKATLDTFESAEVAVEIGNGFALFKTFQKATLHQGDESFVTCSEMHLAFDTDGIGKLAKLLDGAMVGMMMGVEAAKRCSTGVKRQAAFGPRAGEDFQSGVVRVFVASFEDELLILLRKGFEFVHAF